ncbi:substrate-binding domain-containing protein [Ruegeria sp.]|uniref:substrate-binding domain-containing protein n=1 Tax=Ruegeria sp. TaxID=1879320 RepID=UPI00230ACAC7|nr:substrate-binding domain-containing protein [Ruegeria sp.]MDA7964394.1 substrate-binding domain-containing protein [Ruegeria sp.]
MSGKLKIAIFDRSSTNPNARIFEAIRLFRNIAPGVTLDISVEPPNVIEEGVINGRFNLGIVPLHRESPMLNYSALYSESMRLFCGEKHELFSRAGAEISVDELRNFEYAGLSFNSLNMAVHQKLKLRKSAFVQNEEALALLVLSGCYLGFLPTHQAQTFLDTGLVRQINCEAVNFSSQMAVIVRKSTSTGRRLNVFLECLQEAHDISAS